MPTVHPQVQKARDLMPVPLTATSDAAFRYEGGKVSGVILNPGPGEIRGTKID